MIFLSFLPQFIPVYFLDSIFRIPGEISEIVSIRNLIITVFLKLVIFNAFALYKGMYRYTSVWDLINIIKGNLYLHWF